MGRHCQWGQPLSFASSHPDMNSALVNGRSLKSLGRSTAVAFYGNSDQGNVYKAFRMTGRLEEACEKAYTYFYIMQTHSRNNVMPAYVRIPQEEAEPIVDALVLDGVPLENNLIRMGVVSGSSRTPSWRLDRHKLAHFFWDHCVVISGHLASHYWPRYRRSSQALLSCYLCTCQCFGQHLECEHHIYVQALNTKPGASCALQNTPSFAKKRPPKGNAVRSSKMPKRVCAL